jgi:hypothetical protein
MNFRWFTLCNCVTILALLAMPDAIMDLIGEMPVKIWYPSIEGHEWQIVTGCDPKNTRWSYHNRESWLGQSLIVFTSSQYAFRLLLLAQAELHVGQRGSWPLLAVAKNEDQCMILY